MFEGFLRTSAGRYEVAGDQTKAGVGVDDPDFDENAEAGATDRGPDKPSGGHPSQGGGNSPGQGDGEEYETD